MPRKTIFIISAILVAIILLLSFFFLNNQKQSISLASNTSSSKISETHEIILTEEGFQPENITIKKGSTITFSSKTGRFFWPASDIHPTHGIYPAFDPKEPIEADETWSFKFEEAGSWRFHDHLAPYYTGTITVEE